MCVWKWDGHGDFVCTLHGVLDLLNVADQRPMGAKAFCTEAAYTSSHSCSHFSPANNTHTLCTLHMQVWLIWCVRTGLYAEWLALFCCVIYFCILPLVAVATKCPTPHWTPRLLQAQDTNGHNCLSSQLHVCTHRTVWMWRNSSPLHNNMKLTHRVYYVCVYMPNRFVPSIHMYTLHSV